jgi:hypothetical protein
MFRSTGSLYTKAPDGIVMVGRPLNVNARSEAGAIADSLSRSAMCAAPMVSGVVPKTLLNATRARLPPMLVRTI